MRTKAANASPAMKRNKGAKGFPFSTVLVANRGEIAVRLIRGVQSLGLEAVAVYTAADVTALHVQLADVAVSLGTEPTAYTDVSALLNAAKETGAGAVLPGYGFVSENDEAAAAFENAGVRWIGPTPDQITRFASKTGARAMAVAAGVAVSPGSAALADAEDAERAAIEVGFPALFKASAGGGGMGQAVAESAGDVAAAFRAVRTQADTLFGGGDIFVERYIAHARHVEVQVFGNGKGGVVALGLRDCSVQRRRQKVIEEGPPPMLEEKVCKELSDAAIALCASYKYRSAGTVEFVVDAGTGEWFFLEVNTRLQVEHGVTELTTGVDIVHCMIKLAAGNDVLKSLSHDREKGFAIEARIYAENPVKDFAPSPGVLSEMKWPEEGIDEKTGGVVRVDSWARRGVEISSNYDPLLGKVLAHGSTREIAIAVLRKALKETVVHGVSTNKELILQVLENEHFAKGQYTTSLLKTFPIKSSSVEVIAPGVQSSLQDYPGRVGYWNVGVSPSGAMDMYAMNIANSLVGNASDACALEMTVKGATLKFHRTSIIALTGCRFHAEIDDGKPVPWWTPFKIEAGSVIEMDGVEVNEGDRKVDTKFKFRPGGKIAYCAVRGGFDAPKYLGSTSTFPTGKFGGVHGRFLKAGDFLPLGDTSEISTSWPLDVQLPERLIPNYANKEIIVGALNGPHGSEDFLHTESLTNIWTHAFKVHHAANRLGVRLIGPTPKWNRKDGGSAGLHPSNLHDYTYAPGAVNFSGNTPIVLMLDGPSLGGFICPITVATSEMWKVSQALPGSTIRFRQVKYDDARYGISNMNTVWEYVRTADFNAVTNTSWSPHWVNTVKSVSLPAIIASLDPEQGDNAEIKVAYRMSGDEHVLIEYGDIKLDLAYRMRVHMLMEELKKKDFIKELCPGVRSLLVRYNATKTHVTSLLSFMTELEQGVLGSLDKLVVPSRVIHLPLAFNDRWTKDALERYQRSVRPEAPYLPSNVEFVRRINGLSTIDQVRDIMLSAEYCVLGLGDVYLGAPCAVPVDPRHRLVTSKMAPARLFTHEGTVGIGGTYMCIYGMDSPGGYQLMGRTLPIWDSYGSIPPSHRGAPPSVPWLLRFFDRVRFHLVSDDELESMRERYRRGEVKLDIREETFSYKDHVSFIHDNADSIAEFTSTQSIAFDEERARWEASGEADTDAAAAHAARETAAPTAVAAEEKLPLYAVQVRAGVAASVWSVLVSDGDIVEAGQSLFALESMKIELSVDAPVGGIVQNVRAEKGDNVGADDTLCIIQSSRDVALADVSLSHLRSMYKQGVLTPASAASALRAAPATKGMLVLTNERSIRASVEMIRCAVGRRYLPLRGVPFVTAGGRNGAPKRTMDMMNGAGALLLGSAKRGAPEAAVAAVALRSASIAIVMGSEIGMTPGAVCLRYPVREGVMNIFATCVTDIRSVLAVLEKEEISDVRVGVLDNGEMVVGAMQAVGTNVKRISDAKEALQGDVDAVAFVGDVVLGLPMKEMCVLTFSMPSARSVQFVAHARFKVALLQLAVVLSSV